MIELVQHRINFGRTQVRYLKVDTKLIGEGPVYALIVKYPKEYTEWKDIPAVKGDESDKQFI